MIQKIGTLILVMALTSPVLAGTPGEDQSSKVSVANDKQALGWLMAGAQQGDPFAQYNLGYKYYSGDGVPRDYKQALNWFTQSAGKGMSDAQLKLGIMYANGEGVQQDEAQAVLWLTRAAEQGHPVAQHQLGLIYLGGKNRNTKTAYAWFAVAAANGYAQAVQQRDNIAASLSADELKAANETVLGLQQAIKQKRH